MQSAMAKAIDYLRTGCAGCTGRATSSLVEHLRIDVSSYGSTMELRELAASPRPSLDARGQAVRPGDDQGHRTRHPVLRHRHYPSSDGKVIRLPIPPLSGERRKQLSNQVRKMGEEQKVALRNVRRDVNKKIDADKKASTITEDAADSAKDGIQKLIKRYEDQVDKLVEGKTKEIEEG
ncbi:MAG: ribosome recycling factor [Phycisphaerales bacterium]|nr:ribosome recycling factor [Phycisphaerales bacterium]